MKFTVTGNPEPVVLLAFVVLLLVGTCLLAVCSICAICWPTYMSWSKANSTSGTVIQGPAATTVVVQPPPPQMVWEPIAAVHDYPQRPPNPLVPSAPPLGWVVIR